MTIRNLDSICFAGAFAQLPKFDQVGGTSGFAVVRWRRRSFFESQSFSFDGVLHMYRIMRPVALFAESVFVGFSFAIGWVLAMVMFTAVVV
jgi:hypothetical protein